MKFPTLFRLPNNRRFNIEPRYYDPIKEEIEERTRRIKAELDGEAAGSAPSKRLSFSRKTSPVPNSSFLQLLIAAILGITVMGWLYYGNAIFYALWLAVPVYIFYRFRKIRSKSD